MANCLTFGHKAKLTWGHGDVGNRQLPTRQRGNISRSTGEFTLVKRTPFIGTPLWIVFERDGEAEPQQVARFTDFDLACECFDSLVEDAKNENQ